MDVLKALSTTALAVSLCGCQISYVMRNAWEQSRLYGQRAKIDKVIADPATKDEVRRKLRLVQKAKQFATANLGLKETDNYSSYVALNRPYVTWVVHAAPSFKLESFRWWFPIIGHVPYKGFFTEQEAQKEAASFDAAKYDTYVRGVTAYSTLGWFEDPVFSSMLGYEDHDLVNTVIHESVHATVFAKSQADFNERMATFLGDWGTELFYLNAEGADSPTLRRIQMERVDQQKFSDFLQKEMKDLRTWYSSLGDRRPEAEKQERLSALQERFRQTVRPTFKTKSFAKFADSPLNNARLMAIGTYYEDLKDFEDLKEKLSSDFKVVLSFLKNLSEEKRPESALKAFVRMSHSTDSQ